MSTQTSFDRPLRTIVIYFMSLCAAMVVAATTGAHLHTAAATKRALGLLIGIMAFAIGNMLPKVRPLQTPSGDPAKAVAAERFAGWVLVLTGISYVVLFTFMQLDLARTVSSIIGIVAIVIVAANFVRLLSGAFFRDCQRTEVAVPIHKQSTEKRRLLVPLFFAFFWILATACATSLFGHKSWGNNLAWLIPAAFWILFRPTRSVRL